MVKPLLLLILFSLIFISGCSTDTGKIVENTKLTVQETPSEQNQTPESIEELHKEFAEFEKSQTENLSEQNEPQEESAAETAEDNTTSEEITMEETNAQNESAPECPSCEDNNSCTKDSCSKDTGFECVHEAIVPCCGNGECEEGENWSACPQDCECALDCDSCSAPDMQTCSCLPKTECSSGDTCCPENCAYPEDPDCPKPSAVFSEIYYDPIGDDKKHEWVEIYNNGTIPTDITSWRFEENNTQHYINEVTNETTIGPGSYAIIADNAVQFLNDYPNFSGLLFDSSFSLSNTGENLTLRAGYDGEIMDFLLYNSTWVEGDGFSLERMDLNGPNTQENWNQSLVQGGTPDQKNSISP
jgi:hypothetical protein